VPIDKLLASAAFEPDTVALLAAAFDAAWDTVKRSGSPLAAEDRAAATREVLARRIIEAGTNGERDVKRLVDDALAHLTGSK
jgi:transposase